MIRMALNSTKERIRPVFICDYCKQEITDAPDANALFGEPGTAAIFHIHKACDAAFCGQTEARGEPRLAWTTLSVFLAQLAFSSGLRKAEADHLCEDAVWAKHKGINSKVAQ